MRGYIQGGILDKVMSTPEGGTVELTTSELMYFADTVLRSGLGQHIQKELRTGEPCQFVGRTVKRKL